MFNSRLKDKHHIIRYCKPKHYDCYKKEITNPDAFALRDGEKYLSCFWKEYYKKFPLENIYKEALNNNLTPNKKGGFTVISVGKIKEIGKKNNLSDIEIRHLKLIRSYSGIHKTTNDYKFLRELVLISTENYNVTDIQD